MSYYDLVFYFFAIITLASAMVVVFSKNIMYSAFSLLFTFCGVAGLYVLLQADFIAVAQVLIYVGGILVLLIFGVMLTNKVIDVDIKTGILKLLPGVAVASAIAGLLVAVFTLTDWRVVNSMTEPRSTTSLLGEKLMNDYLLPFEVASVVLLVTLIGAALMARRDKKGIALRENPTE